MPKQAAPFIIAEIGSNHCGQLDLAKQLIYEAREAACDAVKFQHFQVDRVWRGKKAQEKRRPFEVDEEFLYDCADYAKSCSLEFVLTPMFPESVMLCNDFVDRWKIASFHVRDKELLSAVSSTGKQIIVSMGGVAPSAVDATVKRIAKLHMAEGIPDVIPLHCISSYPAQARDYGLFEWLEKTDVPERWGISDHSLGVGASVAAVALGATFVEKHVKLQDQPTSPDDGPHALTVDQMRVLTVTCHQAAAAVYGELGQANWPEGRKLWL
jgi:sialic acid synthase SpsE